MQRFLSIKQIENLGFEWPKHSIISQYCIFENELLDLTATINKMQSDYSFYKKQINEAYNFKK